MVALGDADAHGDRRDPQLFHALEDVRRVIDAKPGHRVIGVSLVLSRGRTVLVADTAITRCRRAGTGRYRRSRPPASPAARLRAARRAAGLLDLRPSEGERSEKVREAVKLLDGAASISNMTARWRPMSR
jgi:malate dehydrogenase (oxaloacetate-decarboxylating)(NADP+)